MRPSSRFARYVLPVGLAAAVIAFDLVARSLLISDPRPGVFAHVLEPREMAMKLLMAVVLLAGAVIVLRHQVAHRLWPLLSSSLALAVGGGLALVTELFLLPKGLVYGGSVPLGDRTLTSREVTREHFVYDWILVGPYQLSPADIAIWLGIFGFLASAVVLLIAHRRSGCLAERGLAGITR